MTLPGLTGSQSSVVLQAARARSWGKAPPIAKKALLEALGVEANYSDPNFGDRDSLGSLQQRAGWGSAKSRLNVTDSAERFLEKAIPIANGAANSGELAQAVQLSGFPKKYGQRSGEASSLLRALHDRGGFGGAGADLSQQPGATTTTQTVKTPTTPSSSPLAAPGFSAANEVALPQTFQQMSSGGGPAPPSQVTTTTSTDPAAAPAALGSPRSGLGKYVLAPNANRGGVGLAGDLTHFLAQVSGRYGRALVVGTGTNHNRMTVDGNVSDHWDGHAADIPVPVDSAKGDRIATAALIAAGVSPAQARSDARKGGLYTVTTPAGRRVQVIWKTDQGGNHHNHVHVGYR